MTVNENSLPEDEPGSGSGQYPEDISRSIRPRIFIDADVLIAGSASPNEHSASNLILRMAELTLIEAIISEQVMEEVKRNLLDRLPKALAAFQVLAGRSLRIVADPSPADLKAFDSLAHPEDLPILVAAIREGCKYLVTFNIRHYQPGYSRMTVMKPGDLVLRVRHLLSGMG